MDHLTNEIALFTDLYELKMAQAYLDEGMIEPAVFSLFVRRLPEHRNYLLACGQAKLLETLEGLRFSTSDIEYLATLEHFSEGFLRWLADYRFTGSIDAVPEGTPMFADEPILEVTASVPEAQILETLIMNQVNVQTILASKASRVVTAAQGRAVVDFGARRTHGLEAAIVGARAFAIAGVRATSNVLAGKLYGIEVAGTMAHSYVQAHENEAQAFRAFAKSFPGTTLLVDTYDTLEGVKRAIALAKDPDEPVTIGAIRLDSGDLAALARDARTLLDEAGLQDVEIFVSSSLDEYEIARLLGAGAPIDGFGVGTAMGVASDSPDLDLVYKLCAYKGEGRLKLSTGKPVLPGRKQVFRIEENGKAVKDVIGRAEETVDGRPLLRPAMRDGRIIDDARTDLEAAHRCAAEELDLLPKRLRTLEAADPPYPVTISPALERYRRSVEQETRRRQGLTPDSE